MSWLCKIALLTVNLTISPCCYTVANKTQFADTEMTLASPAANLAAYLSSNYYFILDVNSLYTLGRYNLRLNIDKCPKG